MNKRSDIIRQVFDLGNIDIDQDELAQKIAKNRGIRPYHTPDTWPQFAVTPPSLHETNTLPPNLHAALHQASTTYDQIWVTSPPGPPRRAIIATIKHQLHQLVIFYANKLGKKQIDTNEQLLRALNTLATITHQQNQEIVTLQQQIDQLQTKVIQLEQA
ncbi:MAG: hypothetical protein GY943_33205 [Chloroflexi bacterium]|nr:hypothetical protein [Chloroflexota bacterium]